MTRDELIRQMADKAGTSLADAQKALTAFTETVTEALANGETVQLTGFGTFQTSHVDEKTAKNPRDGSEVIVPAHNRPNFKAGSKLKAAVK